MKYSDLMLTDFDYYDGKEWEKYAEMYDADWKPSADSLEAILDYLDYFDSNDYLPSFVKPLPVDGTDDRVRWTLNGGFELTEKGLKELEDRMVAAIITEYKRFKAAQEA